MNLTCLLFSCALYCTDVFVLKRVFKSFLRFPFLAPVTYTLSDSEDEFDDVGKNRTSKRKAVVSDDDISFAVETGVVSDSDAASPAPAPKAPAA